MNYDDTVRFLYDLRLSGSKLGLQNTRRLAALTGGPQETLRFIHVAGTNGKGSVCAILESIYRAAGYRTGLYTSPHLVSFRERIRVDGEPVAERDVIRLVEELRNLLPCLHPARPTFFEFTTVMALEHFRRRNCAIVIWETGLGGRLDSTNIVSPDACVITNISVEHQKWLGNSVDQIAAEKAGIIKPCVPVLSGAEQPEVRNIIKAKASGMNAQVRFIDSDDPANPALSQLSLHGAHQQLNAALALAVVQELHQRHPVPAHAVDVGLRSVRWPGRLQVHPFPDGSRVLLDGAHNTAGIKALAGFLDAQPEWKRGTLILGMLNDRSVGESFAILRSRCQSILFCNVDSERSANTADLEAAWRSVPDAPPSQACDSLETALWKSEGARCRVITGSLHFMGEAMEKLSFAPYTTSSDEKGLNDWAMR